MARRQMPNPPSQEAQKTAFYKETGGHKWGPIAVEDAPITPPSLYSDIRRLIQQEIAAAAGEKSQPEGTPAKRSRAIEATRWLERTGVRLSDAHGSHCVTELVKFLEYWEGRVGVSRRTAATLAGTLLSYAGTLVFERGERDSNGKWTRAVEDFQARLPAKRPGKRKPKTK